MTFLYGPVLKVSIFFSFRPKIAEIREIRRSRLRPFFPGMIVARRRCPLSPVGLDIGFKAIKGQVLPFKFCSWLLECPLQ